MDAVNRENAVRALLVGTYDSDRVLLRDIFRHAGWRLYEAKNRQRALECLRRRPVHVVITDKDIDGWSWTNVLRELRDLDAPPQLIVASHAADDCLWAEALNVGAFDVLRRPFDRDEVERVIASAWRHFRPSEMRQQGAQVPAAGAA